MVMRKLNIIKTSEKLFHDIPKFKPPRFDLRKRKVLDDPDLREEDGNNEGKDLEKKE